MADDIKFVIGVDNKDVLKAIKDNEVLEKRIRQLGKEYANLDKLKNSGRLSAVAYSKAVRQVDSEILHLQSTIKKGGTAVSQLASGMNVSGKAARRNEIAFQQAGYQIQDFIVQVQGGVNPLIAFSQQGSQLAGFFAGPWGAMIGLGIAALSSLAMAFFSTEQDAKRLEKSLEKVGDGLKDFEDMVSDAEEKISSFTYAMSQVQSTQIQAAWAQLGDDTAGSFEASFMAKMGSFLKSNLWTGFETWGEVSGRLSAESFASAFGTTASVLGEGILDDIGEAIKAKNIDYLDSTIQSLSAFGEMTKEGAIFLEYLIEARDAANGFTKEVKDAATEMVSAYESGLSFSKLDLSLGVNEARKAAELLTEQLDLSLISAINLVNLAATGGKAPEGQRGSILPTSGDLLMMRLGGEKAAPYKTKTGTKGGGKGGKSPQEQLAEFLTKKKEEADLQSKLVGLFGEERDLKSELIKFEQKYGKVASETQATEFEATIQQISADKERQKVLEEAKQQQEQLADYIANSMGDALMSVVDGTMTVKDAFKSMAADIIKELYRVLVVQQLVNSAKKAMGFFADGGVISGGTEVKAYANGGVVGGPTTFPMAGGKTGLMGEAGPEAIMPLKRGANGKLGVQMEGGGGDTINVVQNFNFQANGDATIKQLIAQAAPKIAQMTKSSLLDDRRRGGSTKAAFG